MESQPEIDIFYSVAIGCAVMTLLAGFIVFFVVLYQKKVIIQRNEVEAIKAQHQRDLLEKTIEVEEKERESVAKNLHDDLGALISILRLNNSRSIKNVENAVILSEIFETNKIILNKTSESLRSISKKLASPTLIKLGYAKALKELCSNFNQTGEVSMGYDNQLEKEFILPPQKASHLFRASQEIVNNIIKHSGAGQINIKLQTNNKTTLITFEHDGLGISNADIVELIKLDKGLGLTSIQSRLNIIEATVEYFAPKENNARILITYFNDETKN